MKHFSGLSKTRQQKFLHEPEKFLVSEKLDGSNFIVGRTDGVLWTSRKGKKNVYTDKNPWPNELWTTQFRIAHRAIMQFAKRNFFIFVPHDRDFEIECELISGRWPNTVDYAMSLDGFHIRVIKSDFDTQFAQTMVMESVPYTLNGVFTHSRWENFVVTLNQNTITPLSESPLFSTSNNTPVTPVDIRKLVDVDDPLEVENALLDMHKLYLERQGNENGMITEGVVLTHEKEGWSFKVVDRERFTTTNKENFVWRHKLFRSPRGTRRSISDEYYEELQSGVSDETAKKNALRKLKELLVQYRTSDRSSIPPHVDERNLEAFASLFEQFTNGRTREGGTNIPNLMDEIYGR